MRKLNKFHRHIWAGEREAKRAFPDAALTRIEHAVAQSEKNHRGELRVVIEGGSGWAGLQHGISSRARAIDLFSNLRVWDTEDNSGVLIYLLMAERKMEVVADRGIHSKVGEQAWQAITQQATTRFREGEFEAGVIEAIEATTVLLATHFPATSHNTNELPDRPVRL